MNDDEEVHIGKYNFNTKQINIRVGYQLKASMFTLKYTWATCSIYETECNMIKNAKKENFIFI